MGPGEDRARPGRRERTGKTDLMRNRKDKAVKTDLMGHREGQDR